MTEQQQTDKNSADIHRAHATRKSPTNSHHYPSTLASDNLKGHPITVRVGYGEFGVLLTSHTLHVSQAILQPFDILEQAQTPCQIAYVSLLHDDRFLQAA